MNDEQLTTEERRRIRAKKLLSKWFFVTILVLIAVTAIGGWLAYEPLASPATEHQEEVVGNFEEEGSFTHQAEVQEATQVFDEGTVMRNRPLYYTQISPNITGTYEYAYQANEGTIDIVTNAYLLLQATDEEGNEYWSKTEPLEQDTAEDVSPGEEVATTFSVNVSEAVTEIEEIEKEFGASPGESQAKVVVQTEAAGEAHNEAIANRHNAEFILNADTGTYSVETETSGHAQQEFVETVETEREYGPLRSYGPLGFVAFGLVGLTGLGIQRVRGKIDPTEAELAALAATRQREEFDDWISTGRFPKEAMDGPCVEVDSLEDVVDIAIDCDSRVIEDKSGYYVSANGLYYVYQSDGPKDKVGTPKGETSEIAMGGESNGSSVENMPELLTTDELSGREADEKAESKSATQGTTLSESE